jgi:hypothetical protein
LDVSGLSSGPRAVWRSPGQPQISKRNRSSLEVIIKYLNFLSIAKKVLGKNNILWYISRPNNNINDNFKYKENEFQSNVYSKFIYS